MGRRKNMERRSKIEELMEDGLTYSQARYATDMSRRSGKTEYKRQPRRGWTYEQFYDLGIVVVPSSTSEFGWDVYQDGRKRVIYVASGTKYKDGSCKYYPAITIQREDRKWRIVSLSAAIWVGYLHNEIPAGYVVDHIDNDSFNNSIDNLQLLTIRDNINKNPAKCRVVTTDVTEE